MRVREVRPDELAVAVAVLRGAGLGTSVGRLLEFPRTSPCGTILVAVEPDATVIGGAAVTAFGATGWIGALGVASRSRRRGVGAALTEACVAWLRGRGARTALLHATAAGRPVYEHAGFVCEGEAQAWRDGAPPRGPVDPALGVRARRPADADAILALDGVATGEDRSPVFDALGPSVPGLVVERAGRLAGSAVRSPWGLGPSVVAADADAGLALVAALRRTGGGEALTLSVPDRNPEAARALRAWGFTVMNSATRMRLGPPPAFDPRRVFGMFNLFWG